MKPPSRACSTRGISSAVPSSRGTTSSAANRSTRATSSAETRRRPRGPRRRVPAGGLHAGRPARGPASLDLVRRGPSPRRPRQAEGLAQAGQALLAAPHLAGAQHREHEVDPRVARRGRAEDVQAVADLHVLDLAEPAVDVQQEVVELRLVRAFLQAEVVVELGGLHQRPDLLADRGQLRRVEGGDVGVLVEQLLEPGDVAVGLGARHRRDQVVDERGVRAALGLRALARVVDQERVDQRQVAERGVGAAATRTCPASCPAATPGCRACRGARSRRRRSRPRPAARRASGRRAR